MALNRLRNRLGALVFTAFPSLAARWARRLEADAGAVPWAPPRVALARSTLALVTTGGVHLSTQPPFVMDDPDGDPTVRELPVDAPRAALTITHDYYDHRDADRDLNLVWPAERLREWVAEKALGRLHATGYAFMGHIDGPHLATFARSSAPQVARRLRAAGVDYALLVPA